MTTNQTRASLFLRLLMLLTCASFVGCDGAPDGMVAVSGAVTWNGQPIETGYITFVPDRSKSPQAGKIENGRFQFNAYPGQNVVQILSEKKGAFSKGMNQYTYQQFLPAKYNDESELSEEVSDEGGNVFQFALTGE